MEPHSSNLPLTKRQNEILKLVQSGLSNKEVARILDISDGTVKQHLVEVYRRLKVNNRTKAAQMSSTDQSVFLSPEKKESVSRGQTKTITFSAALQPLHCVKIHLCNPYALLHKLGNKTFTQLNHNLKTACEQSARRFDGVVQGSIEGPLVLFGATIIREDDSLRAVCCAGMVMEIMEKHLAPMMLPAPAIQIVVYSVNVISCTDGQTTTIQGELLTQISEEGRPSNHRHTVIVLSPDTQRAVSRLRARYGPLSPLFPGSTACPLSVRDSFSAPAPLTPFVGREAELAELHQQLALARQGNSKALLVVGEAGFGMTRLVQQFREEISSQPDVLWLHSHCHSVFRMVPLHPFLTILELLAGCEKVAPIAQRWEQLTHWVTNLSPPLAKSGRMVLSLLKETAVPASQPQTIRQDDIIFDELAHFIGAVLPSNPAVIVLSLDNLQWMDHYSRLLLSHLANRLNGTRIWLLGAGRKAELRTVLTHSSLQVLSLSRLANREIQGMLKQMPVATQFDLEQTDLLLKWSRGVPLFAVEIAQHLVQLKESVLLETIQAHNLFPDSLLSMVLERLQAISGMDWKMIRALAASSEEVSMSHLLSWNLHGDAQATEAVTTHLFQAGLLQITSQGQQKIISFSNEMVRAAIRKTLSEIDLV
ncbi:MAG: AAA family ATPase [Magnetococcales bacterium]|nr:AAA family ATPase [Magnetococcales bacterium]